ncbi:MAG: polyphosphate kinase 2 family protein [Clostridiaceae bacterium]
MNTDKFRVSDGKKFQLKDIGPDFTDGRLKGEEIDAAVDSNIKEIAVLQDMLYAHNKYGILIILQAMDAAGKDSTIKHIMTGLNPQGVHVNSFKAPSLEELDHDYLWRSHQHLPERGNLAIFNRSYYEDVIVVKVHNLLSSQNIPDDLMKKDIWKERYRQLCDFERYMTENGIVVLKYFLHISKEEQGKRLLERIDNPQKNWKFSAADLHERQYWNHYQDAYEEMIRETATEIAPWYIVPADRKWFSRLLISEILKEKMKSLPMSYPKLSDAGTSALEGYRKQLSEEVR